METQKELANGQLWFKAEDDIPNVDKKLFALQNLCTDCKVCEVACSLIHSPDHLPWKPFVLAGNGSDSFQHLLNSLALLSSEASKCEIERTSGIDQ